MLTLLFRDRLNVAILNTFTALYTFVAHCTFVVIFLMNVIVVLKALNEKKPQVVDYSLGGLVNS